MGFVNIAPAIFEIVPDSTIDVTMELDAFFPIPFIVLFGTVFVVLRDLEHSGFEIIKIALAESHNDSAKTVFITRSDVVVYQG